MSKYFLRGICLIFFSISGCVDSDESLFKQRELDIDSVLGIAKLEFTDFKSLRPGAQKNNEISAFIGNSVRQYEQNWIELVELIGEDRFTAYDQQLPDLFPNLSSGDFPREMSSEDWLKEAVRAEKFIIKSLDEGSIPSRYLRVKYENCEHDDDNVLRCSHGNARNQAEQAFSVQFDLMFPLSFSLAGLLNKSSKESITPPIEYELFIEIDVEDNALWHLAKGENKNLFSEQSVRLKLYGLKADISSILQSFDENSRRP